MTKKNIVIFIIGIVAILLIVNFFSKKDSNKIIDQSEKTKIKNQKTNKKVVKKKVYKWESVITDIKMYNDLDFYRTVRVKAIINEWVPKKEIKLNYNWFVNGENIDNNDFMLDQKYLKKSNEIYCRIDSKVGEKTFNSMNSETIIIKNAPPVIKHSKSPHFNEFGTFVYKIKATDLDGDKLTYSLINSRDGMSIDMSTGDINWDIKKVEFNKGNIDEYGNHNNENIDLSLYKIIIKFKVTDSEGAETLGSITFNTATGSEGGEE